MWKRISNAWNGVEEHQEQEAPKAPVKMYNFEQIKELASKPKPNVVLVDVREPSEYEVVSIPGSLNVPYRSHPDAFSLGATEFQQKFHFPKPDKNKEVIFFCASGMRASNAQHVAAKDGYEHTAIYPGSMNDWVSNGGDKLKL